MSSQPTAVRIVLKDGSVIISSLHGAGVDASCQLWQGITAREFYPADVEIGALRGFFAKNSCPT